ncbi:alkane hydroxylase MAH1-like [Malania oleifera]|uniref:alkane hydroxylase MAH1-like n=1 Tax=Malania oleifera TaxID=397392 RepID=UPI0025AE28B9|nr:alkane hydroxylase MAH1-like [Malania oleifera]
MAPLRLLTSMGYPEIILSLAIFLLLRRLKNGYGVLWNFPLVGMLPGLLLRIPRFHDRITAILNQSAWTFSFKGPSFAAMDMLCTTDPSNVHYIMSKNFSNFPKGSEFHKFFDFLGDGIFNSDADAWRNQRRIARAFLGHNRFNRFLVAATKNKVENGLVPVLDRVAERGLVVDLQDFFKRFMFDATCQLVTGYDPESLSLRLPEVPFSTAMDDAEKTVFRRHILPESYWKLQRWLGVGEEKKLSKAWETIDHFVDKCISMKREELRKKEGEEEWVGADLLTLYMKEDEPTGDETLVLDDKFLRDTIVNFMLAGRDTTAAALTWFFWLLSKNPSVETKIREELALKAKRGRLFEAEELNRLVYLHASLCEALRLYPPVPFEHKAPLRPDILPSGHRVDPKVKVVFSLYSMGRMDCLWGEDCLEFKPERWMSERGGVKHEPSYKFMAFNAGPRSCLGKEVAFTQMKAVAATIISGYGVAVVEGHPVVPDLSIILHMKNGLRVKVTKRDDVK